MRTCNADMTGYNGFVWPESGHVSCSDWEPTAECGHGLHGLLDGEGHGSHLNWGADAKWLVVAIKEWIDLGDKVKFPSGEVVFCGSREDATRMMYELCGMRCIAGGNAMAGYRGTAMAGYEGTAVAGDEGTAVAGIAGTAMAGDEGTAVAGYAGTAMAGYKGIATTGFGGLSMAGNGGTATAGDRGTATAGYAGTASAGIAGTLVIEWWDGRRYRLAVGYVGEDGLLPGVAYGLDDNHRFVPVDATEKEVRR
jgi:hypothetical protein